MLITDAYLQEQHRLHENEHYGVASIAFAPLVSEICNKLGVKTLLDYGAGKGRLMRHLKVDHAMQIQCYDPAVPRFAGRPDPAQMVVCIDVLEHVEPECLDDVLDDLMRLTQAVGFFTVHTGPAIKTLSDGRNAHLIQQPPEWWLPKIIERFELQTFQRTEAGFYVIVYALGLPQLED